MAHEEKPYEIVFKSSPENWFKEAQGQKRNTIRKRDLEHDARFGLMDRWLNGEKMPLIIGIKNTETGDIFYRNVTDVTKFEGVYVVSW